MRSWNVNGRVVSDSISSWYAGYILIQTDLILKLYGREHIIFTLLYVLKWEVLGLLLRLIESLRHDKNEADVQLDIDP